MRMRGVLAVEPADTRARSGPEQRRLLDTCASLLAISLERIHYIDVAQKSTRADRVGAAAQLAAVGDLARPAHAAGRAGRAGRHAGADASRRRRRRSARSPRRCAQSALRMNALVNNLLDMARLEAGAVPTEPRSGSRWRRWSAARWPPARRRWRAGRCSVTLADDLPLLHLDAVLIERVLVNLLENAAKYTPRRQRRSRSAPRVAGDAVLLHVDDHGPGPARRARRTRSSRSSSAAAKESATPGVGPRPGDLPRHRAGRTAARIRGRERAGPGGGTAPASAMRLPRGEPPRDDGARAQADRRPEQRRLAMSEAARRASWWSRTKPTSAASCAWRCRPRATRSFEADGVQRGLIDAGTRRPDLVVLDLGLPDGDGVDLIRELRSWSPRR